MRVAASQSRLSEKKTRRVKKVGGTLNIMHRAGDEKLARGFYIAR